MRIAMPVSLESPNKENCRVHITHKLVAVFFLPFTATVMTPTPMLFNANTEDNGRSLWVEKNMR